MERIKGANGELMKYSMQPMDGKGHLTLYRYDQLAVGGADNAHLEFWQEIEELRKQRADAQATIAALQAQLATCFKLSGADPDSNEDWRLAPHAVEEVTRLRKDYDELGDETEALREQLTQRTAELEALKIHCAIVEEHKVIAYKDAANLQAELEAAKADRDELQSVFDLGHTRTVEADKLWQEAHGKPEVCPDLGELVGWLMRRYDDLQAELERVSLLSSHNERRFEEVDKKYKELRTLILTLPKVEGEIEIYTGKNTNQVVVTYKRGVIIGTLYGLDHAKPVAALYKHRQGMEGVNE